MINTGNCDLLILSFVLQCFSLKHLGLGPILSTVKENDLTLKSRKYNFLTSFNQTCSTNYTAEFPLPNVSSLWFFFYQDDDRLNASMISLFRNKILYQILTGSGRQLEIILFYNMKYMG